MSDFQVRSQPAYVVDAALGDDEPTGAGRC
jgi:hypothetical protein